MSDSTGNDLTGKQLMQEVFIPIIKSYLENKISLGELETQYFNARDTYFNAPKSSAIAAIFNTMFVDIDAATSDPPEERDSWDIGEDELRRLCAQNLAKLDELFKSQT